MHARSLGVAGRGHPCRVKALVPLRNQQRVSAARLQTDQPDCNKFIQHRRGALQSSSQSRRTAVVSSSMRKSCSSSNKLRSKGSTRQPLRNSTSTKHSCGRRNSDHLVACRSGTLQAGPAQKLYYLICSNLCRQHKDQTPVSSYVSSTRRATTGGDSPKWKARFRSRSATSPAVTRSKRRRCSVHESSVICSI